MIALNTSSTSRTPLSSGAARWILIPKQFLLLSLTTIFWTLGGPGSSPASAANIVAGTANRSALIGGGYQSEKENLVSQACLQGSEVLSGTSHATFSFDQALSEKQASEHLGLATGGRARFGAAEVSGSANFMRNTVSNEYSISAIWLSEYRLPARKLASPVLSQIGSVVSENIERWAETCGDEYIDEITIGARLFFSVRIDFSSKERKQEFEAKFSVSGPLYSANASLDQASKQFSRDAKITITAFQLGGDISKLTGIFPNTAEGSSNFVQCGLGDLVLCAKVIQGALSYATDLKNGFPSQLAPGAKPGGAPLQYLTAKYSEAGVFLKDGYPFLREVARQARVTLHTFFEREFARVILSDRLIELGMGKDQLDKVLIQRKIVDRNLTKILDASRICYVSTENCPATVSALNLAPVDDKAFVLPQLATASFRAMTTTRGIWSREASIEALMSQRQTPYGLRRVELAHIAPTEEASIILFVEGHALSSASLYFENRLIKTISLRRDSNSYPEKFGDNYAAIVVQTTRFNPGWLDVDLAAERRKLWAADIPKGDGVFYLVARDSFGRDVRFDIEYQQWQRTVTATPSQNSGQTESTSYQYRNRWWSRRDGGTSLVGEGEWSNVGSANVNGPVSS